MSMRKRKVIDVSQKLDIIAEYNEKATPTQLSIKYGLSIGTIGTIVSAASQEKLLNLSCDTKIKAHSQSQKQQLSTVSEKLVLKI